MPWSWGFTLHEIPPKIGENQANREGGIMKNEMLSFLLDEKICLYNVTSKYTTKFLAGHYD
jgi:hypothetical protein